MNIEATGYWSFFDAGNDVVRFFIRHFERNPNDGEVEKIGKILM